MLSPDSNDEPQPFPKINLPPLFIVGSPVSPTSGSLLAVISSSSFPVNRFELDVFYGQFGVSLLINFSIAALP